MGFAALYPSYAGRWRRVIAMVALARHLILDMKEMSELAIASSAFAVLILAAAVLVIRYGHVRFPYQTSSRTGRGGEGNH